MACKVLFVCVHNSARSQLAEEYLRLLGGDDFQVESAGLEPGTLNPYVVEVLKEDAGVDISAKPTQDVFELFRRGRQFDYVITVCGREAEARCPVFPGLVARRNWNLPDPSQFVGSYAEIKQQVREIRDQIVSRLRGFLKEYNERHSRSSHATHGPL